MEEYDLNMVGNTNGGTWHLVISSLSKKQEMVYDFLSFMANKKNALWAVATGWTGVQPGMKYEYFPPNGTGNVAEWTAQGWNESDALDYLGGYYRRWQCRSQDASRIRAPRNTGTSSTSVCLPFSAAR